MRLDFLIDESILPKFPVLSIDSTWFILSSLADFLSRNVGLPSTINTSGSYTYGTKLASISMGWVYSESKLTSFLKNSASTAVFLVLFILLELLFGVSFTDDRIVLILCFLLLITDTSLTAIDSATECIFYVANKSILYFISCFTYISY